MKKKRIDYRKFPGLKIICRKCGYEIHNIGESGLKTDCRHPLESQVYKAVLIEPRTGKRKTRILDASSYDEALAGLLKFKDELRNPVPSSLLRKDEKERPMTLSGCFAMYLDYLQGIGVFEFEKKNRSGAYIKAMAMNGRRFMKFLKSLGINPGSIRVDEVTGQVVDQYYKHVKELTDSSNTLDHLFRPLKGLYKFLIDKKGYVIRNPFKNVLFPMVNGNPKAIGYDEVVKIKRAITPEGSVEVFRNGTRKNRYRPWLSDAIDLALYTGLRREQIVEIKWSDVECDAQGRPEYIRSSNLKVNRMLNGGKTGNERYVNVPVSAELLETLNRLGLNSKSGTDSYVLAPDAKISRKNLLQQMSACFRFYRNKAGVSAELSFKSLRKTYLSAVASAIGTGNVKSVSGHSGDAVLKRHYIDAEFVARNLTRSGFRLFDDGKHNRQDATSTADLCEIGSASLN